MNLIRKVQFQNSLIINRCHVLLATRSENQSNMNETNFWMAKLHQIVVILENIQILLDVEYRM